MKLPIETKRLFLREFKENDFAAIHSFASNPDTVKYMDWGPNSEEDTRNFLKTTIQSQLANNRTAFELAITLKDSGLLIGSGGIRIQDERAGIGDFGYILHSQHWGRGIGTEAAKALVLFGFNELKLNRIWATCRPENTASARVLEKTGLCYEETLKNHKQIRGKMVDSLLYAIHKSDFKHK